MGHKDNVGRTGVVLLFLCFVVMGREFSEQPKNTTVQEHQPLLLKCQIHSIPAANVQWERSNLPLPQSIRYVNYKKNTQITY